MVSKGNEQGTLYKSAADNILGTEECNCSDIMPISDNRGIKMRFFVLWTEITKQAYMS